MHTIFFEKNISNVESGRILGYNSILNNIDPEDVS
jgi:hypothetical protein